MQSKILIKWLLFIASSVGTICCSIIILFLALDLFGQNSYAKQVFPVKSEQVTDFSEQARSAELPVRLKIPKIKVDAALEHVGLTSQGAVDVPKKQGNAAWFELGPRPGESGSAVITGHYGWKDKKPSVFDNLYKLRKGDKIYVYDEKGATTTFVVRESKRYKPTVKAPDVFVSSDGKAHLNLITCEGIWNKFTKSYSTRLVVFAEKE